MAIMDRRPLWGFTNFTGRNDATVDGQKERQQPANTRHVGDVGGGARQLHMWEKGRK